MKVSKMKNVSNVFTGEVIQKEKVSEKEFSLLSKVSDSDLKDKLEGMLNEIDELGKILADKVNLKEFKKYREKISSFINEIATNSLEFSRDNYLDHRGRLRDYGIIRKIDKVLDEMASDLITRENKNIDILSKIDQIKGLLMDILT